MYILKLVWCFSALIYLINSYPGIKIFSHTTSSLKPSFVSILPAIVPENSIPIPTSAPTPLQWKVSIHFLASDMSSTIPGG